MTTAMTSLPKASEPAPDSGGSFLPLGQGYKNFMPKVINLTDDASKADVVELEEVK